MKDITTREDIEIIMAAFYEKLLNDSSIGYIFTDVAKIDLPRHLPHLADFWEQNVLGTGSYRKNVLQLHLDLNRKTNLNPLHFQTWLMHFGNTIDSLYSGSKAEVMKTRALSIATVMQIKLQNQG